MGEEEGFEDWDEDFLDQLIQVEERALIATQQQPPPQQLPYQPPPPPPPPPPPFHYAVSSNINYSPPRVLSQRIATTTTSSSNHNSFPSIPIPIPTTRAAPARLNVDSENEREVNKLKRELELVSKKLSDLEQESLELKKERDKKEKPVKSVLPAVEANDAYVENLKKTHSNYGLFQEQAVTFSKLNEQVGSRLDTAASTYKGVGVQTENFDDSSPSIVDHGASQQSILSKKLLAIWSSPSGQRSSSDMVSKLFVSCAEDFQVLSGCLNTNVLSKTTKTLEKKSACDFAIPEPSQTANSSDVSKISHLYTVLTKISSGMFPLEVLFEALLDLCDIEKVAIVYRCLRILHVALRYLLLNMERGSERRDNVVVEEIFSGNKASYTDHTKVGLKLFDSELLHENDFCSYGPAMSVSCVEWGSLFKLMHRISMRNKEEHVINEAASIMVIIFLKSNAYSERDKFEERVVFESISQLIRKEAGIRVQKQAVQLFYLSLNCPKLLLAFCSGYKEVEIADVIAPAFRGFSSILQGLADSVASCGDASQDLRLSRDAIIVLAFLASSGNAGFEIVLSHKLSKTVNFLVLILRLLVSELNVEAAETPPSPERFKERTLLIREALIFLNRLVSNPVYSSAVLRVLTSSRDAASLTVDIANRLSRKDQGFRQRDSMVKQMRETEIVDLARAFRKRVFAYLGEKT